LHLYECTVGEVCAEVSAAGARVRHLEGLSLRSPFCPKQDGWWRYLPTAPTAVPHRNSSGRRTGA